MRIFNKDKTEQIHLDPYELKFGKFKPEFLENGEPVWVYNGRDEEAILENELNSLKNELSKSDYKAIKFAEGLYSEEEYKSIKKEREKLREEIRKLQDKKKKK
jgi:hypothetical protein